MKWTLLVIAIVVIALVVVLGWPSKPLSRSLQVASEDCVLVCVTPTAIPLPTATFTPVPASPTPLPANARKGVVFLGPGDRVEFSPNVVTAGWWYDYYQRNTGMSPSWTPMIRPTWWNQIAAEWTAQNMPGRYWLVLNEPDRADQDNTTPAAAATWYHDRRAQIIAWDAQAQFIIGNVSNIDFGGFSWLRDMRDAYAVQYGEAMPLAGYGAHIYDCVSAQQKWRDKLQMFVNWQTANSMGGKQLWITEMGCLNSDVAAGRIMREQVTWLTTSPLVTRFSWFATMNDAGSGDLLTTAGTLTALGQLYVAK
jgi:hypothetical protein